MDVGIVKAPDVNVASPAQRAGTPADTKPVELQQIPPPELQAQPDKLDKLEPQSALRKVEEEKTVETSVQAVNQFMDLMNADLRFSMHQKTNRLMVQLVSERDQRVLREYPSKEFLDMVARIRDAVGIFMDKKA